MNDFLSIEQVNKLNNEDIVFVCWPGSKKKFKYKIKIINDKIYVCSNKTGRLIAHLGFGIGTEIYNTRVFL